MLADKTGVEMGQAWLVQSSFCQKATYACMRTHTVIPAPGEEKEQDVFFFFFSRI